MSSLLTGLIAYYKLDESSGNASDSSGSGFTLTNNNTVTYTTAKINNGADFGTSNTSRFLDYTGGNMGVDGGSISFNMWVKVGVQPTTSGDAQFQHFIVQGSNNTRTMNLIRYFNDAGTYKIQFERGKNNVGGEGYVHTQTLTLDTWFMLTYTYDGTTVRAYVNNSLVGSGSASGSGTGTNTFIQGLRLGRHALISGGAYLTQGQIDEVGVWSKALTTDEITSLYNSGNGAPYPFGQDFSILESLSLSESQTSIRSRLFAISESIGLTETFNALTGKIFQVAETITTSETFTATKTMAFNIIESLFFNETAEGKKNEFDITETLSTSEKQSVQKRIRNLLKSVAIWTNKPKS